MTILTSYVKLYIRFSTGNFFGGVEYTYDAKDRLTNLTDGESGNTAFCTYDNYDRRLGYFESNAAAASNPIYDEQFTYNMYGDLATAHYGFGTDSHEYALSYREDFARTLDSVTYTKGEADLTVRPQSDCLGRNTGKELEVGGSKIAEERRYYRQVGDHATNMVSTIRYGGMQNGKYALNDSVKYAYDKLGNVEKVYENGALTARYTYDRLNRLIREDNKKLNRTFLYEYDNNGNILSRREYLFTLEVREALEECTKQDEGDLTAQKYREYLYNYVDDRLMSYDGEQYAYDALGNPTTYRGKSVSWSKGRQMDSYDGTGFTYDGRGRRIAKGSLTFSYTSDGKLIKQSNGIEFIYDNSGVAGINYNGIIYVYRKNIFGDIVNLLDNSGNIVVKYEYDSWGNHIVKNVDGTINNSADFIGNLNPIRYRGYYYDSDINLYYLKTRYYDPEIGRFMTIDDVKFIASNTINGLNLYAYCANNPVMRLDPTGNSFALLIFGIFLVVSLFTLTYSSSDSNDKKVYYDVPLYSQGGLNLCWAYCQVMVEAYQSNTKLTQKEADARAKEIAIKRNGAENWNSGGMPSNKGKGIDVSNIEELYNALIENGGPLYALYRSDYSPGHLVVVTGVNLTRNIVYTNNPWNVRGEQSFSAFQNGVARYPWQLDGGLYLSWVYMTK